MQPPREEGAEAWRALETGPIVLASVYLRDADVSGALAAIDRAQARELLESERPQFAAALEAAAQEPGAARCIDLLAQLRPLAGREPEHDGHDDEDFVDDRDLFGAAAFSVASECYRLDPTVPQVALTIGVALEELGMAEATPAVLVGRRAQPPRRARDQRGAGAQPRRDGERGRRGGSRTRRGARSKLPSRCSRRRPTRRSPARSTRAPARLRAAMGEIDLREGRIDEARALLKQSADEEKSGGVLLSLARIEWRDGQTQPALSHLTDALTAQDVSHDPALRGEVLLLMSDVARDKGDVAAARTPLTEALKELVQSRGAQGGDARARVERVLSRVLDRFGAAQPAQRALERAYAAAPGDRHQATQTIELLIGRAFVRGDLPAARDGLERALGTDLDADDLVYFALWVRLLERQKGAPTDGTPDHVFGSIADDGGQNKQANKGSWVATLARFGEGRIKGDELMARAATPIQKYEALFYSAMDRRASGDTKGGDDLLRQVVAGTGLELSEVSLARDLLDPTRTLVGGPLPPDVSIP